MNIFRSVIFLFILILTIDSIAAQQPLPKAQVHKPRQIKEPLVKPNSPSTLQIDTSIVPVEGVREFYKDKDKVQITPEQLPEFPGGQQALNNFINTHLLYPVEARANKAEGIVIVQFTIEVDGRPMDPSILEDKVGFGAREEVFRLISLMPKWKPGYMAGTPVPVTYTMPVNFKIKN